MKNAFYMSVSPDKGTAKAFIGAGFCSRPDGDVKVVFEVLGYPSSILSAYEREAIFKPDTSFRVEGVSGPDRHGAYAIKLDAREQYTGPSPYF